MKSWILKILLLTIRMIPWFLRIQLHAWLRRFWKVDTNFPKGMKIKIASSPDELNAAFEILHEAYVAKGYMQPHQSNMRVTPYHLLPSTVIVVAKINRKVIATMTLVRDSKLGLPVEKAFDLTKLRKNRQRIAEVSSLAVHKDYRNLNGLLLYPLMKYMQRCSMIYFGAEVLVIGTHPKIFPFYEITMLFREYSSKEKTYDFVNGAPLKVGIADVRTAYDKINKYKTEEFNGSLASYLASPFGPEFELPQEKFIQLRNPLMTSSQVKSFKRIVPELNQDLQSLNLKSLRAARMNVSMQGVAVFDKESSTRVVDFSINEISETGIRAKLSDFIRFGKEISLILSLGKNSIRLRVLPIWADGKEHGFSIVNPPKTWINFIRQSKRKSSKRVA